MAYLGNGIYDLLDVVRASNNPQINYEGLYQDASAPMATSSLLQSMKPGYEFRNDSYMRNAYMNEGDDLSGNISTDYNRRLDFRNYFNNQPLTPTDGVNRFIGFNPRVGIVNAGLPINNINNVSQINDMSMIEDYPIVSSTNEEDEEQVESLVEEEPSGIQKLLKTVMRFAMPGLSFLENRGQPYQQFSPGTTIRNGIVSVAGVNTPYSAFGGDFYNPNTGLNRFDRARNRFNETRSLKDLFGASRTLAEFNNARKILEAQKKSGYKSDFMNRPKSERNYTGPSGGDNTGGDIGAKGAADSFSNKSGMGRTGY